MAKLLKNIMKLESQLRVRRREIMANKEHLVHMVNDLRSKVLADVRSELGVSNSIDGLIIDYCIENISQAGVLLADYPLDIDIFHQKLDALHENSQAIKRKMATSFGRDFESLLYIPDTYGEDILKSALKAAIFVDLYSGILMAFTAGLKVEAQRMMLLDFFQVEGEDE